MRALVLALLLVAGPAFAQTPIGGGGGGSAVYAPSDPTDWDSPVPDSTQEGLDQLGDRVKNFDSSAEQYTPALPSNWIDPDPAADDEGLDSLADHKSAIQDLGTITEVDYNPLNLLECNGPQCVTIWGNAPGGKRICYSEVEGTAGWACVGTGTTGVNTHGSTFWAVSDASGAALWDTVGEVCAAHGMTCTGSTVTGFNTDSLAALTGCSATVPNAVVFYAHCK